MQAVRLTRNYIKSAAISIFITTICLLILIPKNINHYTKISSLIILLIKILYRIYFCSNWYIYGEYIPDDTCIKAMMIEVMMSQRGYRMVYYGIINLI